MARSPFFSVITPTYNREAFLEEMILSVANQTFKDYEHIIVDDGSTDNTESLIKGLMSSHPKIVYIKQENKGRSVARNVGIEHAKGEFVCFLDSDDVWLPDHLETLKAAAEPVESPVMLHTGLIWFYDDGSKDHYVKYANKTAFKSNVEYVIANEFAPDCVCIHHTILEDHQFDPKLFINEDVELWARIAASNPIVSVPHHTAKLRVHTGNTNNVVQDNISPQYQVFQKLLADENIREQLSPQFISQRQKTFRIWFIRLYDSLGDRNKLVRHLISFLVRHPFDKISKSFFVLLVYNLPGGQLLKKLVAAFKGIR